MHACRLAEKLGISGIVVPSGAGVGSAIGFLRAAVGYEVIRSLYQRLSTFDVEAVNRLLTAMYDEARAVVDKGRFDAAVSDTRIAFMRYVGQGHEIPVPLPVRLLTTDDVPRIHAAYETEYAKYFDRPVPGSDVEIMSFAVILATTTPKVALSPQVGSMKDARPARSQFVRDSVTGAVTPWCVYDRSTLSVGDHVPGPAVIAEDETSTLIGQGWRASVNSLGYIEIVRGDV